MGYFYPVAGSLVRMKRGSDQVRIHRRTRLTSQSSQSAMCVCGKASCNLSIFHYPFKVRLCIWGWAFAGLRDLWQRLALTNESPGATERQAPAWDSGANDPRIKQTEAVRQFHLPLSSCSVHSPQSCGARQTRLIVLLLHSLSHGEATFDQSAPYRHLWEPSRRIDPHPEGRGSHPTTEGIQYPVSAMQ